MSDSEDDPASPDIDASLCACGFRSSDDEDTGDSIEDKAAEEEDEEKVCSVSNLVDLAAKVTGKHCSCMVLDSQKNPPLDERMIKKVAFWAFPQDEKQVKVISALNEKTDDKWEEGEKLFNSSKIIKDVRQIGFMVNGILRQEMPSGGEHEIAAVTLSFEKQRITSTTCSACHNSLWCRHVNAVLIYRMRHAAKVPIHAPLTEVLSFLHRNQLQMVIQHAIRENPGAIIGRVFKHMDSAFDRQSDMNKELCAPDPTFGLSSEETQITELSLEQIGTNLEASLRKMRYSSSDYPDTSDYVKKVDSNFCKQYFKKVVDLVNNNEPELSGKILIKVAQASLDEVSSHHTSYLGAKRVLHDTERLFCCFILSNTGPIREEVIRAANDLNGIAKNTMTPDRFLKVSEWADISCLKLDSCVLNEVADENEPESNVLGASPTAPFYQALCASLVLDAPPSLGDVLSGNSANTLTTSYDEPLPVMMLRFDWLMYTSCLESNKELYKLGIVILRRLIYLSDQFSITGSSFPLDHLENSKTDYMQTMFDDQDDMGPSEPKKARFCSTFDFDVSELNTDDISAVLDIIDAEMVDQEPPDSRQKEMKKLTKSQVSYSLLYVCYYMYHIKDMISVGDFELPVVMNATLRAIEIGRFHSFAPKDSMAAEEYKWLLCMEKKIQESYLSLLQSGSESVKTYQTQVFQTYSSALRKKGLRFYGNHLAVKLLVLLLKIGQMDQDAYVQLCVDAICFSVSPLQGLNIPDNIYLTNNMAEMKGLWTTLLETLFQPYLKEDNTEEYSDSITKVLQHLGTVEDCSFCVVAYQVFKHNNLPTKFTIKHKDLFLRFIIHSIKQSNLTDFREFSADDLCNTIKEVGPELETAFPALIFPAWNDTVKFFCEYQRQEIAQVLTESIQKCGGNPPRKTFDMMFKYFEANFVHGSESCELMKCLTTEFLRHEALKKINSNHCNYTPDALFLIAKMEHENNLAQGGSQDGLQHGNIFRKNVFMMILFAFHRIHQKKNDQAFTFCDYNKIGPHLNWCFDQIAQSGNEVKSGSQYDVFIENLLNTFDDKVQILVSFLKEMEKCEPLLSKAKKKFNTKLVDCYRTHFFDCMQTCRRTSYERILKDMSDARRECVRFVENGSRLFKTQITDPVRRIHKGKRKFLFLMNQNHQDLLQDNDEESESEGI